MRAVPYDQARESDLPPYSVGTLYYETIAATAWISAVITTNLTFRFHNGSMHKAVGIAVTSAHATLMKVAYPAIWSFFIESVPDFNTLSNYIGVPLMGFRDEFSQLKDPINNHLYSIPEDIMLFLILEYFPSTTSLFPLSPAQSPVVMNTPISIFGYPFFSKLEIVYPTISVLSLRCLHHGNSN